MSGSDFQPKKVDSSAHGCPYTATRDDMNLARNLLITTKCRASTCVKKSCQLSRAARNFSSKSGNFSRRFQTNSPRALFTVNEFVHFAAITMTTSPPQPQSDYSPLEREVLSEYSLLLTNLNKVNNPFSPLPVHHQDKADSTTMTSSPPSSPPWLNVPPPKSSTDYACWSGKQVWCVRC